MSLRGPEPLDLLATQGWALLDVAGWDGTTFRHFEPGSILLTHFRREAIATLMETLDGNAELQASFRELFPGAAGVVSPGLELVMLVRMLDGLLERKERSAIDDPSDGALAGFLLPEAAADAIELLLHADAVPAAGRLACAALVAALADLPELREAIAGDARARRRLDGALRIGLDLGNGDGAAIPDPLIADAARWIATLLRTWRGTPR